MQNSLLYEIYRANQLSGKQSGDNTALRSQELVSREGMGGFIQAWVKMKTGNHSVTVIFKIASVHALTFF